MLIAINYHYIRPSDAYTGKGIIGVTPESFQHQLTILGRYGEFVSGNEIVAWIQGEQKHDTSKLYFHVTFDDGLSEQFVNALPILQSLNIPATFFVNTENIVDHKISDVHKIHALIARFSTTDLLSAFHNNNPSFGTIDESALVAAKLHYNFDDTETAKLKYILNFLLPEHKKSAIVNDLYECFIGAENTFAEKFYMSAEQVKHLMKDHFIGSHGHNHIPMGLQNNDKIESDLNRSNEWFAEMGYCPSGISYPYGSYESLPISTHLFQVAGFKFGFTMERAANHFPFTNSYYLARFDCNDLPGGKNPFITEADLQNRNVELSKWF